MKKASDKYPFEPLDIPRREVPDLLVSRYRVYKTPDEYVLVKAESAQDALKGCGFENVYRVERDSIYLENILKVEATPVQASQTADAAAQQAPAQPQAAPAAAEAAAPAQAAPAQEQAALSSEEVNKLLNG